MTDEGPEHSSEPESGDRDPQEPPVAQTPPSPWQSTGNAGAAPSEVAGQAVSPSQPSDARLSAPSTDGPTGASGSWWEQPVPSASANPPAAPVAVPAMGSPGAAAADAAPEEEERTSVWRWLWEAALLVALAFAIAYLLKLVIVQPFYIPSGSMEPTLFPGDRVLVSKLVFRFRNPEPGDVVVFGAPRDVQERDFIKRVVAIEGQTVEVKDGKVYVDGKLREEPYVASQQDHTNFGPVTVADDNVFVMGDNRANSSDSRVFGPFDRDRILGEAFVVYWPLSRMRTL